LCVESGASELINGESKVPVCLGKSHILIDGTTEAGHTNTTTLFSPKLRRRFKLTDASVQIIDALPKGFIPRHLWRVTDRHGQLAPFVLSAGV
jgi:hypothetical protein